MLIKDCKIAAAAYLNGVKSALVKLCILWLLSVFTFINKVNLSKKNVLFII